LARAVCNDWVSPLLSVHEYSGLHRQYRPQTVVVEPYGGNVGAFHRSVTDDSPGCEFSVSCRPAFDIL